MKLWFTRQSNPRLHLKVSVAEPKDSPCAFYKRLRIGTLFRPVKKAVFRVLGLALGTGLLLADIAYGLESPMAPNASQTDLR